MHFEIVGARDEPFLSTCCKVDLDHIRAIYLSQGGLVGQGQGNQI